VTFLLKVSFENRCTNVSNVLLGDTAKGERRERERERESERESGIW